MDMPLTSIFDKFLTCCQDILTLSQWIHAKIKMLFNMSYSGESGCKLEERADLLFCCQMH